MNAAQRKQWHIEQALRQQALPMAVAHPFDRIRLTHNALPEVNFDEIDLSAEFFGKSMASPMFVSAMTGGIDWANDINRALAEACRERGWAMGVGSQRIQLDDDRGQGFEELRHWAGDIPLFANFGAVNLLGLKNVADLRRLTDPLQADALVLHLNPMQEVFQYAGDLNWKGVARCIEAVCRDLAVPVVIKEVGFGITPAVATQLAELGVAAIDVAGRGGTRFDSIEAAANTQVQSQAEVFADWGQDTVECLQHMPSLPIDVWASGGLRNGLDVAKSMALGASACGFAGRLLEPATQSTEAVIETIDQLSSELRLACFGLGVQRVSDIDSTHIWKEAR